MTQYNSLNVNLSNSKLNKLKVCNKKLCDFKVFIKYDRQFR